MIDFIAGEIAFTAGEIAIAGCAIRNEAKSLFCNDFSICPFCYLL